MTLLLDTHAFLWFCQGDPALSKRAKAHIEDPDRRKWVSLASCWEIAIKAGMKKLILGEPASEYIPAALRLTGFEMLPIALKHVARVEVLPPHHRDPFDRLLVAQALLENVPLVSADSQFERYGVMRIW